MRETGFEALVDGMFLLTTLLLASGVALSLAAPDGPDVGAAGTRVAAGVRLSLFRTSLDGLAYAVDGVSVPLPDNTTVATFLRIQVHLRLHGPPSVDFGASNARIEELGNWLVAPGWEFQIMGGPLGDLPAVRIPEDRAIPETRYESGWVYPALDERDRDVRLTVAVWLNPR